jgi:hypothetical protein
MSCAKVELDNGKQVTFEDVKSVLERSCLSCHSPDGKASQLPLTNYDYYRLNAKNISKWVENKKMPPFDPESDGFHYMNKEYLQGNERQMILDFLKNPKLGNTSETLELQKEKPFEIGENGSRYTFGKGITIPPRGFLYRCFFFKIPKSAHGKFLTKLQIKGKYQKYIHHNIYHITPVKSEDELKRYFHPEAGCILPDQNPILGTGEKVGFFVEDDVNLVVQVHFDRTMDETTNTIVFDEELEISMGVEDRVETVVYNSVIHVPQSEVIIPYGKKTTTSVTQSVRELLQKTKIGKTLQNKPDFKIGLKAFLFHMHLYGKSAELVWERAQPGSGKDRKYELLLRENNFDSRHQYFAILRNTVNLSLDDYLRSSCVYDNSAENPKTIFFNPTKRTILGGFSSSEEMCSTYMVFELPYSEFKR